MGSRIRAAALAGAGLVSLAPSTSSCLETRVEPPEARAATSTTSADGTIAAGATLGPLRCTGTLDLAGKDLPTGSRPTSVVAADLNGDGKPDLAVTNFSSDTVSVLLGKGDGSFAPKVDYPAGPKPDSTAAADLNGDGKLDLVVGMFGSHTVSVLLGRGDGSFAPKVDYPTRWTPNAVAVADLNGDGHPDLAIATEISVAVLLNHGDGTFAPALDYPAGKVCWSIAAADLNGDGKPDLAVTNLSSDSVSVLLNRGDGTFATHVDYPTGIDADAMSIVAADLNGDGKPDLALANSNNVTGRRTSASVLLNHGDGTFAARVDYPTGMVSEAVAAADLNGDGALDLAVADARSNTVIVLLNHGDGTFVAAGRYPAGAFPRSIAAADLNGDGRTDLAVADWEGGGVTVLLNTCTP